MKMARQLYNSPVYIQQQKATLEQILGSMNQAATAPTVTADTTAPTTDGTTPTVEVQPIVAQ
jgi:hypothetical protein